MVHAFLEEGIMLIRKMAVMIVPLPAPLSLSRLPAPPRVLSPDSDSLCQFRCY